jgi:hypothetical protein
MARDAISQWNGLRAPNAARLRETPTLRAARRVWPSEWTEARVTDPAQGGATPGRNPGAEVPLSTRSSDRRSLERANCARVHRFAPTESEARLWERSGESNSGCGFGVRPY